MTKLLFNGKLIDILTAVAVMMIGDTTTATASDEMVTLMKSKSETNPLEEHITTFQRIYGKENKAVHAEVHRLELESTHYKRTGMRDLSHEVEYNLEKHPLHSNQNRMLNSDYTDPRTHSKPLRITFITDALDSRGTDSVNAAKIAVVKSEILPSVARFWSDTLNVAPVIGPLKVPTIYLVNGNSCGSADFSQVPTEHVVNGVANTDLILYVSGNPNELFCGGVTLAAAITCSIDQFDRPTAGAINICLDTIVSNANGTISEDVIQQSVDVVIHEVAHVLGLNSAALKFIWDPATNQPRTARPFTETTVECVDGITRNYYGLPDENTVKLSTDPISGQRSAFVVTPKVRTVARNQFNCQDLVGAQLENQPTNPADCFGSHWDERLFYSETLSGIISPTTVILSPLTLAFFEDSGWYFANYNNSALSPFGHGAGCDFVRKPCLVQDNQGQTSVPDYGRGFFCSEASVVGCSPSNHYKVACPIFDYSPFDFSPPPLAFQYFSNPNYGSYAQTDYCPVYALRFDSRQINELDCRDPLNLDETGSSTGLGEEVGRDSLCFENNFGYAICYKHKCDTNTRRLSVSAFGSWFECERDFQEIAPIVGSNFKIICPRLATACPEMFCPLNCEGRGTCNWDAPGGAKCECFDLDMSESCSFRLDTGSDDETFSSGDNNVTFGSSGDKEDLKMKLWTKISLIVAAWVIVMLVLLRFRKDAATEHAIRMDVVEPNGNAVLLRYRKDAAPEHAIGMEMVEPNRNVV